MEIIDLSSQNARDDNCEYVDLSRAEIEVYESLPLKDAKKENFGDQRLTDNGSQVNLQNIPEIRLTRSKLKGLRLEQHADNHNVEKKKSNVSESVEQRLSRIKDELEDIKAIQETTNNPINNNDLEILERLHNQLHTSSQTKILKLQQKLSGNNDANSIILPRITLNFEDSRRLLALNQRVSILEKKIGLPDDEEEGYRSLTTKLEMLFRQIKLLRNDSDMLGQFHEKISSINKDYEDSLSGRRAKTDAKLYDAISNNMTNQETKVGELYKYHKLLECYGPVFPKLLEKIKEISTITDKIHESYDVVNSLNSSVMDLQSQASKWGDILTVIDQKLDQQTIDMEKNISYTNKKLAQLESNRKD